MRPTLLALAAVLACAAALVPLVSEQAGRGTQWIGAWALSDRLVQIPGYFLLGANGSVLGHGLLALAALPLLAAIVLACVLLRRGELGAAQLEGGALMLALGVVAILIPLGLALAGADYLAPRNLIADWVPLSAALALVLAAGGRAGLVLAVVVCLSGVVVLVATDLDPRLERAGVEHGGARAGFRHSATGRSSPSSSARRRSSTTSPACGCATSRAASRCRCARSISSATPRFARAGCDRPRPPSR